MALNDIDEAEKVEITVDSFGKVWINVNDKCVIRIGHAKSISMDDPLRGFDIVYGESDVDNGGALKQNEGPDTSKCVT